MKKKRKTQIDIFNMYWLINGINHTQEGIGHSHKLAGQREGEPRDGKWRRDKKA
jgi:hypothetical protein